MGILLIFIILVLFLLLLKTRGKIEELVKDSEHFAFQAQKWQRIAIICKDALNKSGTKLKLDGKTADEKIKNYYVKHLSDIDPNKKQPYRYTIYCELLECF